MINPNRLLTNRFLLIRLKICSLNKKLHELKKYFMTKRILNRSKLRGLCGSLLILFIFFVFTSCENTNSKKTNSDLVSILKKGKLVALTGFNAYSYFIYRGQPMGFEYELVKKLADDLGVTLEIVVVKNINKMFEMLNNGEGDLIAFNLTVTKSRAEKVLFTNYHHTTQQVLVQRRPDNWRMMRIHEIENQLIRNPVDLENKIVYVRKGSSYHSRMINLSEEIGGDINIIEADSELTTEDLIKMVSEGKIDYTISDENIALLNQAYYSNIDIETQVSLPQKVAWAVRKNSLALFNTVNKWLEEMKNKTEYYIIFNKYYRNRTAFRKRLNSEYFSLTGGKLSEYDDLIKNHSNNLNWDWRVLASLIYQESQFKAGAKSWAGAVGLMQLMPITIEQFEVKNPEDPKENLEAGIRYLTWLDELWKEYIIDKDERFKFVIASYNIGYGHIIDARNLAEKYGADPNLWSDNVETYLLLKSQQKYYNDEVVKNGYCRGTETINYVKEILDRYYLYKQLIL